MFTALLDTCVLWPDLQRDFLLSLAIEGMYRPVWSSVVLEELEYEQRTKLIERGTEAEEAARRARRLVEQMRQHFDDAEVGGWEGLEGTYGLPDPDDEHLVAAAVVANAGAIITLNVRDLPSDRLPRGLQVLSPKEFAANTVSLDPVRACAAVATIAKRSGRMGPIQTEEDILETLTRRYGMTSAVEMMRQAAVDTSRVRPPQPRVSESGRVCCTDR
ncbi:PIN domain-containing protein [Micromonospora orduensis]|uniref:PIN domain-containing protein n=1 Tax=Micromonospora orduensis TaxID=1420891 RepID=A0A5C4QDQ0_9ACTN|nr:PIN domain-containing protein [Micromonospora orduensis]TNH24736.1 PIN domain-containing protein [Micromonospora orduensis]